MCSIAQSIQNTNFCLRMSQHSVFKILTQAKAMWLNQVESNGGCGGLLRLPPGLVDYMVEVILNPVPEEDVLEASLADLIIDLLGEYALQVVSSLNFKITYHEIRK